MNTLLKAIGLTAATAALVVCGATSARAGDGAVKVPFPFMVGNTELPAGSYVVKDLFSSSETMAIESADGRTCAYMLTIPDEADRSEARAGEQVVFEKFDNHYFLSEVTSPDGTRRDVVLTPALMKHELARAATRAAN
jgi:hypothetical protein